MTLYEINDQMTQLVDPETGEVMDMEAFDALSMAAEEKLENVALWIKNLTSDVEQLKAEEKNLAERRKAAERKAESLKGYLAFWLNGQKFETPRVKCSWRKSEKVIIPDEAQFTAWARAGHDDLLTYKEPTPNLTAIKAAIKDGVEVIGASIVTNNNLSIK